MNRARPDRRPPAVRERTAQPQQPQRGRAEDHPRHAALADLPAGLRVQDGFVRRLLVLEPRARADAEKAAEKIVPVNSRTREAVLAAWADHARDAAGRYRQTGKNNPADDQRHLAFAAMWAATVAATARAAPAQRLPPAAPNNATPGATSREPPTPERKAQATEENERRQTSNNITSMLRFAQQRLTPGGSDHLIQIANDIRVSSYLSREEARAAFAVEHLALKNRADPAEPPSPKQMQIALAYAAIAAAPTLDTTLQELHMLPTVRVRVEHDLNPTLANESFTKGRLDELLGEYENAAVRHAVRGSDHLNQLYAAALHASKVRERVDGFGDDWAHLAHAYLKQ